MLFNRLFLSQEECNKIISLGEGKWENSLSVYKKEINTFRKSKQYTTQIKKGDWLYNIVERCFSEYNIKLTTNSLFENQIIKYDVGGFIAKHNDVSRYDESGKKTDRVYVLNIVLNQNFGGGDFVWYDKQKNKQFLDKSSGIGAIFKTNELHEVTPVTEGTRYSFSVFLHNNEFEIKKVVI